MALSGTGLRARAWQICAVLMIGLGAAGYPAQAQIGSTRYASFIMKADSGEVLSSVQADELRHPASLTKMMTLYMVFEALRDRRITLTQSVPVSAHAAAQMPTKLGLMPGTRITVEEAILGLVTKSANDAASALGEMLGGEEARFGQMMTLRARALGMTRTVFRNASGLPDASQITTARDMATLGRHLVQDFPHEYSYFAVPSFRFHGRIHFNHDQLLQRYAGADGIKTGYVEASGYNLVSSAVRGNTRLIGVVMGAARGGERDLHMMALLDQAYIRLGIAPARNDPHVIATAAAAPSATVRAAARALANWSVQVGAFSNEIAARHAARTARQVAAVGEPTVERTAQTHRAPVWRAILVGLTQAEASAACGPLQKRRLSCIPRRPAASNP
ncbi:MAG: D-alanyl-D-alanine carboxypeptidase [Acetobacteraceae bacterium]|nr:D-alanyl-D-alanine carboxypeptidase [Acetobacteraceae bacterium]